MEFLCCVCQEVFEQTRSNRRHCSKKCAKKSWFLKQGKQYFHDRYASDPERHKANSTRSRRSVKDQCFAGYGGYVCSCCGIVGEKFCTLDHVRNDGASHRRSAELGKGGERLYRWAIKHGFPATLQVLCWNCNCAKNINGGVCPHKEICNV